MSGATLNVGSRAPQLLFSFLVIGLPVGPSRAALVPVVPRDAHGLAPAGKRKKGFLLKCILSGILRTLQGSLFSSPHFQRF